MKAPLSYDSCTLADSRLRNYSEKMNLSVPVFTHLIVEESSSQRTLVESVIQYSNQIGAEMILLTSYGRHPIGRMLLGSFAERLLAESPIPILFLNSPSIQKKRNLKVLFPTDFSTASRRAFEIFNDQFQSVPTEVTLFHANPPVHRALFRHGLPFGIPDHFAEDVEKLIHDESTKWIKFARKRGYPIQFELREEPERIARSIKNFAQANRIDLIALATSRGKSRHKILGSVSSALFSIRGYPVWICGPEAIRVQHEKARSNQSRNYRSEKPERESLWQNYL